MQTGAPNSEPPSNRGRGRPSTLDREAVLTAAWRVIAERGLERTRYIDVAESSGTPVSTLQNAFGNLKNLLNEAIDQASQSDAIFLSNIPGASTATPPERMRYLVAQSFAEPDAFQTWLVWLELWRAAARDSRLAFHTAEAYELWWSATEAVIADGQATGDFTSDLLARDLAIAVVAMLDGCATAMLLRAKESDPGEAARIAHAAVVRMLAP